MKTKKTASYVDALCSTLLKRGALKQQDAESLKKLYRDRSQQVFDQFLIDEGLVAESDLLEALSDYYQVPYFDPVGYFFNHRLVTSFPKDFLMRNCIIPVEVDEDNFLVVIASDPSDPTLPEKIGSYVSYDVVFRVGLYQDILDSVESFYDKSLTEGYTEDDAFERQEIEREAHEIEEGRLLDDDE